MKKIFIATAIDYVNDVIHLGHIYQKIAADVLARYFRQKIGKENVYFLTGTDEHGLKAQEAASIFYKDVKTFVDEISALDKKEQEKVEISFDRFIRTTDEDHISLVKNFWQKVYEKGDIYLGDFTGYYCQGCEAFKTESELINGRCNLHFNLDLKLVTEKNYFFRWYKYKSFLKDYILNHKDFVLPEVRKNEVLAFVDKIEDITISRKKESVFWGIDVPNDNTQVIYVWFDALINYLTAGLANDFWNEETKIIHILGKDNLRWHALLWPAMLQSAGYKLPDIIYAHGFITLNGQKISKSLGNVIRPSEIVNEFGADALRYYILSKTTFYEDSDISIDKLKQVYNADLANGLGNFIARVLTLALGFVFKRKDELDFDFLKKIEILENQIPQKIENFRFFEALNLIWQMLKEGDIYINLNKPWQNKDKKVIFTLLNLIIKLNQNLAPFLPLTFKKIEKILPQDFEILKIENKLNFFPRK